MYIFDLISNINPSDPSTYEKKIFLTFDLDFCSDEVLEHTIGLVNKFDLKATWFITHNTPLLMKLKRESKFEIGIHPNFNNLLLQKSSSDYNELIKELFLIHPGITSVRSHSLITGGIIQENFKKNKLTHESNYYIPWRNVKSVIPPWVTWNGLKCIPHFWEDDAEMHQGYGEKEHQSFLNFIQQQGFCVIDFHPIHLWLNTGSISEYFDYKLYGKSSSISQKGKKKIGMLDHFISLMNFLN